MNQYTGWQLNGSAPEAYERYIGQAILAAWTRDLVESAAVQPRDRVLDVACGTGVVVRHVAPVLDLGGTSWVLMSTPACCGRTPRPPERSRIPRHPHSDRRQADPLCVPGDLCSGLSGRFTDGA